MWGSEIVSNDPVSKKPRLEDQDKDQDMDHGEDQYPSDDSMSEDESDSDVSEEYDSSNPIPVYDCSNPIPLFYDMLERRSRLSDTRPDSELGQIVSKVAELKSKGFKGITFTAQYIPEAFECLHIHTDPGGIKVSYEDIEWCNNPEVCVFYVSLLKKFADSPIVSAEKYFFDFNGLCHELFKHLDLSDKERHYVFKVLDDYNRIYYMHEVVDLSLRLRKFLLESESKEKYRENPKSFEERLMERYRFINAYGLSSIFEAVVKWWAPDSEKGDEESARKLIDNLCERAQNERRDRLKWLWTRVDYMKLKLDVAKIVGIFETPDEIANFVLPGHHRLLSSHRAFVPVSYELE